MNDPEFLVRTDRHVPAGYLFANISGKSICRAYDNKVFHIKQTSSSFEFRTRNTKDSKEEMCYINVRYWHLGYLVARKMDDGTEKYYVHIKSRSSCRGINQKNRNYDPKNFWFAQPYHVKTEFNKEEYDFVNNYWVNKNQYKEFLALDNLNNVYIITNDGDRRGCWKGDCENVGEQKVGPEPSITQTALVGHYVDESDDDELKDKIDNKISDNSFNHQVADQKEVIGLIDRENGKHKPKLVETYAQQGGISPEIINNSSCYLKLHSVSKNKHNNF